MCVSAVPSKFPVCIYDQAHVCSAVLLIIDQQSASDLTAQSASITWMSAEPSSIFFPPFSFSSTSLFQQWNIISESSSEMKGVEDRGDITLYWKHLFSELHSPNNHWMYRGRAHDFIIWRPSIYLDIISNNYLRLLLWYAVRVSSAEFENQLLEVCTNVPQLWTEMTSLRLHGKKGQIINTEHMIILSKDFVVTMRIWLNNEADHFLRNEPISQSHKPNIFQSL